MVVEVVVSVAVVVVAVEVEVVIMEFANVDSWVDIGRSISRII